MAELYMIRTVTGFAPANGEFDKIKRHKIGDLVLCKFTAPRNVAFHRKFFSMLNMVFSNQELTENFEFFRSEILIEAGFFTWEKNIRGQAVKLAKSISFAKMDQVEFEQVYSSVFDVCMKVLRISNPRDVELFEKELINYL